MKDLTEAELIEMERRAVSLVNDLEDDAESMSRVQLKNAWDEAREQLAQVAQDVETLCGHVRGQVPR